MIPPLLLEGLQRYIDQRVETGSFLRAVLSNDLTDAVRRADPDSFAALPLLLDWLRDNAPAACWGSPGRVQSWLRVCQMCRHPLVEHGPAGCAHRSDDRSCLCQAVPR